MAARSGLLSALKRNNFTALIQCTKKLSVEHVLKDTMAAFSRRQLQELWDNVQNMLVQALQDTEGVCADTCELLQCVTRLADGTFSAQEGYELYLPPSLIEVAILVHGIMPSLMSEHSALKDDISRLFERWWIAEGHGREELMGNTLVYLLDRSTQPKSMKADVARVKSICHVLDSVNLDQDGAGVLVELLLHCCVHPQYLDCAQGIKFLAYLLTLNPELTRKLHQAIKNRLPITPVSWHAKFSEVYFRAWQEVKTPTMKEILEHQCIQDLMYRAIHARRGGPCSVAKVLFRVLSSLHKKKTHRGVESMLTRLYEPILWRSLLVANSDVRINAAMLMFDIFPLQDADLNREHADAALQKQFDIMHSLLSDPVPEVRLTAVRGMGQVLNIYWELIPADVIKCFVTKLVEDLAYDISSPVVREAVLKAMLQMCDNHLCIPMLQTVLPQLQNFVHDTSEKVRLAMFELLLKVKGLRAIKFWNLVPVEHVLARLQVDSTPVVRRIMKLIQPSFVPLNESAAEQVTRCVTLIKLNAAAARQFFLNLPQCLSFEDSVKYITMLCRALIENARKLNRINHNDESPAGDSDTALGKSAKPTKPKKKARKTEKKNVPSSDEQDSDGDDDCAHRTGDDCLTDSVVFCGLVEAVYLMHTVILSELDNKANKEIKESLAKKLSVTVRELMPISKDPKLDTALVALASHLPSRALPQIAQNLFKRLKSGSCLDGSIDIKLITKSLVLWGKAESVIQLAKDSLEDLFMADTDVPVNKASTNVRQPKPSKKAVTFVVEETKISQNFACTLIMSMITSAECRLILLTNHKSSLVALVDLLMHAVKGLDAYFASQPPKCDVKLYFEIHSVFLRLVAFLCTRNDDGNNNEGITVHEHILQLVNKTISWSFSSVVPHLRDADVDYRTLAATHLETIVKFSTNLMMVGLADMSFLEAVAELFHVMLKEPESSIQFRHCVLRGLYQLAQLLRYNKLHPEDSRTVLLNLVTDCTSISLANLVAVSLNAEEDESERSDSQEASSSTQNVPAVISEVTEIILELTFLDMSSGMIERLVASILEIVLKETNVEHCQYIAPGQESLPPWTASLLTVLLKRGTLKKMFFEQLQNSLDSNKVNTTSQIKGILGVLQVLTSDSSAAIYKSLGSVLDKIPNSNMNEQALGDLKRQIRDKLPKDADIETAA